MRKQPSVNRASFSCNQRDKEKPMNESQVSNLLSENQKLHQQNDKLIEQLEMIRQEYESLTTSGIQSIKSQRSKKIDFESNESNISKVQKEKLITDNECLRRTISKLQNQVEEQTIYIRNLERQQHDYELLKLRLEDTVQVVNDLEIQLSQQCQQQKQFEYNQKLITLTNIEAQDQLQSHQKMNEIQISQLKEQNNRLNKLLEERLIQLENLTKLLNQRNDAYNKLQESYDKEINELKAKGGQNSYQWKDHERKMMQTQISQLKQQVEKYQLQQKSRNNESYDDEKMKQVLDLSTELKQKDYQIKAFEQQVAEFQQNAKQIQTVLANNSYANTQAQQHLQKQIQIMMQEIEIQKQNNQKLSFDNNQLRLANQQLNDKLGFYTQSQPKMINNYSHSFVSSPGRLDTYPIKTSPVLTNRTNLMPLNPPDSPFRKQKLHLLFTDDQQKPQSVMGTTSSKKIVQVASKLQENEQRQTNKDRFLLHD